MSNTRAHRINFINNTYHSDDTKSHPKVRSNRGEVLKCTASVLLKNILF